MAGAELGDWHGVKVNAEGRVTHLDLEEDGLAGPLPSDMQQRSALKNLILAENQLSGPIPAELGQLGALEALALGFNQLSGVSWASWGLCSASCFLNFNELSGEIPAELGQLGALTHLNLNPNQLSGSIPAELGQMETLTGLYLSANPQLTGQAAFQGHMLKSTAQTASLGCEHPSMLRRCHALAAGERDAMEWDQRPGEEQRQ